jgi:hypothetical protein
MAYSDELGTAFIGLGGSNLDAPLMRLLMCDAIVPGTQPASDSYVYLISRPDGRPCYVGKGRGNRWLVHARGSHNSHLANIYAKADGELPVRKVCEKISDKLATELEVFLIQEIGREKHGGPLVNKTDGGEGTVGFDAPKSAEHRKKIGLANMGRFVSEATCRLISQANKGRKRSPEAVERSAAGIRGRKRGAPSAETLLKMSVAFKGKKHSEKTRLAMSAARKGKPKSESHALAIGKALKGRVYTDTALRNFRNGQLAVSAETSKRVSDWHASLTVEQKKQRAANIAAGIAKARKK